MATVAAVIASTHHPFYYRASTSAGPERPPFADEWVAKIEAFRQTLTRAEPDVLVMVGSDHFHQLWLDNMPQFLVGKAPFFDANWYNEEREFGLPKMLLHGEEDLRCPIAEAEQFYRALHDAGCATELVRIAGMAHMGDSNGPLPARRAQNEALLDWFERYL